MGQRNRHGENTIRRANKLKLVDAIKKLEHGTRAKAERALAKGADPNAERFLKHQNYHVRAKAWRKMGMPLPEDAAEREKFLQSIHVKLEQVAGFNKTGDEVPQTEEQVNG